MRIPKAAATRVPDAPAWLRATRSTAGAAVMYILVITGLIATITIALLMVISADLSAGIRQLQAVRVFHNAEAGVHTALAKLQVAGGSMYAGETVAITDGATSLGTSLVAVNCLDGTTVPCTGTYGSYRRIASTGALPSSGPTRTLVVVVQGFTGQALCAILEAEAEPNVTIYGDIGSNGIINLLGSATLYSRVRNDPPLPYTNNGLYTGDAFASGAITCAQGCPTQVQGTTTANIGSPVCPSITVPSITPGSNSLNIDPPGFTMNSGTGYAWDQIFMEHAGTGTGCTGPTPFNDLSIQTGPAGSTTIVSVSDLQMGRCGRLILVGYGNVELRVERSLTMEEYARFGVLATDTLEAPAPVPASRLKVIVGTMPNADGRVAPNGSRIVAGSYIVAGNFRWDNAPAFAETTGTFYGALLANEILFGNGDLDIIYDPTNTIGGLGYFRRITLRSWKDQ